MTGPAANNPFWMPDKDRKGRPIPHVLLDAAHLVWPRVLYLTERELKDTALAAGILDKAVSVVSNIMHRRGPNERIVDVESYLYWVAARILYRAVERDKLIQFIDDLEPLASFKSRSSADQLSGAGKKILIKEIMSYMDHRTRRMFLLRVKGYSWAEIGEFLGIKANNAAVHYNHGITRARQRILRCRPNKQKPIEGGTR